MKNVLLYKTNAEFIAKEGNSGNVTSVEPGVAYIEQTDKVAYNPEEEVTPSH